MSPRAKLLSAIGTVIVTGAIVACSGSGSSGGTANPAPTASKPAPTASGTSSSGTGQAGNPDAGKQAIVSAGCIACHVVPGIPEAKGTVGPSLEGFASRPQIAGVLENNPENLRRWLSNPPAVKPGTAMPNLNLSQQQLSDIIAYLETLK